MTVDVEVELEPGLRYVEDVGSFVRGMPVRRCLLYRGDAQVSELELASFRQRFGAVSVPAEGIGGVETKPEFRRQGYVGRLLRTAVAGMAQRVDVAFVSEAVEGLYEAFGFVTAAPEARIEVPVRTAERIVRPDDAHVRTGTVADLPAAVALYNREHAGRPWTQERPADWNRLRPQQTWKPGTEMLTLDVGGTVAGYAFLRGRSFGDHLRSLAVLELTARDVPAVGALLAAVAELCWSLRLSEFTVAEPIDGLVGRVARGAGCAYRQTWPPSGGMMAAILNRSALIRALEPELHRRAHDVRGADDVHSADDLDALANGEIIPDDATLIRLLLGYWSAQDAAVPSSYQAWFPGGGAPGLPLPHAHELDRY